MSFTQFLKYTFIIIFIVIFSAISYSYILVLIKTYPDAIIIAFWTLIIAGTLCLPVQD
jgi:hypothetical protein